MIQKFHHKGPMYQYLYPCLGELCDAVCLFHMRQLTDWLEAEEASTFQSIWIHLVHLPIELGLRTFRRSSAPVLARLLSR